MQAYARSAIDDGDYKFAPVYATTSPTALACLLAPEDGLGSGAGSHALMRGLTVGRTEMSFTSSFH